MKPRGGWPRYPEDLMAIESELCERRLPEWFPDANAVCRPGVGGGGSSNHVGLSAASRSRCCSSLDSAKGSKRARGVRHELVMGTLEYEFRLCPLTLEWLLLPEPVVKRRCDSDISERPKVGDLVVWSDLSNSDNASSFYRVVSVCQSRMTRCPRGLSQHAGL